jgi:microcystin degradation protein MlrC
MGCTMSTKRRILLAGIFHETHSFVAEITSFADFEIRRGEELTARRGDGSMIDGFLEIGAREGWDMLPVSEFNATPSGVIDQAVIEAFTDELLTGLRAAIADGGVDAVLLALHGAMVSTGSVDPEGELFAAIRAVPGAETVLISAAFDLHANFTEKMAEGANILVGFRENPHTDARETAVRAADLLARALNDGETPRMRARNATVIWAPPGTGTADRPMQDLEALARQLEADNPDFRVINVIGGYAFSDVPSAGVAFSVATVGDLAEAEKALDRLEALTIELRELGIPREWDIDEAIARIKDSAGTHIIVEPADNIGGGGPGDMTPVLRAFLRHDLDGAAVIIADPESVAALEGAHPGEVRTLRIGGKQSPLDEGPVELDVTFVSASDGRFDLEDRHSHAAARGIHCNMGPSAVVTANGGKLTILLNSKKTAPFDLAQWRSQGITPENLRYIGVKAAVAHRQAYNRIGTSSHTVRTPGPCTSDLPSLPYKRLRPGVFPIDPPWRPQ